MYNKKVLAQAVKKLDKKKTSKPFSKDIIKDPAGQWKYPGQNTRIPSNQITMKGVDYPVWAQPNVGQGILMQPGEDYYFANADYVDEYPQLSKGGIPDLPLNKNRKAFKNWTYSFERKQNGGDIAIPELTKAQKGKSTKRKPLVINDPKEFAYRDRAYKDSLDMYHYSLDADKYFNAANNASTPAEMSKNMKLETKATHAMVNLKKNSPAKFGNLYAKQKPPVQPVQLGVQPKAIVPVTKVKTVTKTKQVVNTPQKLNINKPVTEPVVEKINIQEDIGTLPLKTIDTTSTLNPQMIPNHYIPITYPHHYKGHWSDGSDGDLPKGMTTEDFKNKNKAHRAKFLEEWNKGLYNDKIKHYSVPEESRMTFQDGGSIELDLTPEEIQAYKDQGYNVDYLD